jgi:HSP20 family protein
MAMMQWDPHRELAALQERMNRLFTESLGRWDREESYGSWVPAVDIHEEGDHLVLSAELPGMRREDIDISVENGTLTVKGERRRDAQVKEDSYVRVERHYGVFSRSFSLPTNVDTSAIRASYREGILRLVLPKAAEARAKRIPVSEPS